MKIAAFYENILEAARQEKMTEPELLARLHAQGLQKIYSSYYSLADREAELTAMFRQVGLEIEGLYCYGDLGNHPEDSTPRAMIDMAARVGAANVLIVPGPASEDDMMLRQRQMDNMASALRQFVAHGRELGVAVSMEDLDKPSAPYNTIEGLKWFMDHVEGLMCSFDTGNFVTHDQDELVAFDVFKDKICTLHLKDRALVSDGVEASDYASLSGRLFYPTATGHGCLQIKEILSRLKAMSYSGGLIIEIFNSKQTLLKLEKSLRWLKANISS